ncbi:unnamed protein product [Candidula unifasciata]|uniref:TLC domain-containing protein n=1 Tax=Candidula unifasciata TaxID=100452 RepID=A0A8S4A5K1_9EUPU|nr:unnamed protein product [Candidula unifasciata]
MAAGNETTSPNLLALEQEDFSQLREAVSVTHGQYLIVASVLFFQLVNLLVKSYGPPKSVTDDEWKWRNLVVSWVHAMIASLWVIACTVVYPELYCDLLQHISHLTFYCVCFSTGYFVYDFLDLVVNNKMFSMWELTVHHIGIAGMFYYNICIKSNIGMNIIALSVELNSVFLHWRKLLQMMKMPFDSPGYIIIKYLNIISFLIFRGGALVVITGACIMWRQKVSTLYYIGISSTTFFMDIVNVILFWRLFKSDFLRGGHREGVRSVSSRVKCDSIKNGNNHVITSNSSSASSAVKSRKPTLL